MVDRLHDYQGWTGRYHEFRDTVKARYTHWVENRQEFNIREFLRRLQNSSYNCTDFAHLYRRKSRWDLIRISAAVMGIEFSYAAETAFVSPLLLKIGVKHQKMTLVWALSPFVGFFLCPFLGSLSDRCRHNMGRRRPFIILLSIGVLLGLLLVPNGEYLGYKFGDTEDKIIPWNSTFETGNGTEAFGDDDFNGQGEVQRGSHGWGILFTIIGTVLLDFDADACQSPARAYLLDVTVPEDNAKGLSTFTIMAGLGGFMGYSLGAIDWDQTFIGVFFGGHVRAVFSLITIIFIFCVSVTVSSFSEIPLPLLEELQQEKEEPNHPPKPGNATTASMKRHSEEIPMTRDFPGDNGYGTLQDVPGSSNLTAPRLDSRRFTMPANSLRAMDAGSGDWGQPQPPQPSQSVEETSFTIHEQDNLHSRKIPFPPLPDSFHNNEAISVPPEVEPVSLGYYLRSILFMPKSLRMVCLTNLFCWMAHVCYSLYFTDFVGEAVFGGDPKAAPGSDEQVAYEEGLRFGCWGMAMYSLSCACYSLVIESLIERHGAKKVYVGGLCFYSGGMALMAITRFKISVLVFSWTAGVMYSTLFTMPYLLVANYHNKGVFALNEIGEPVMGTEHRGLGTDVAIISSMVFMAQFILSLCMGTIISWSGTTAAVVSVAALLALCGAISATQVMYLDL